MVNILIKYKGNKSTVKIPQGIDGFDTQAFADSHGVEEIIFPASIQSFGSSKDQLFCGSAFRNMPDLKKVVLPDGLKFLGCFITGEYVFEGCTALKEVNFPKDISMEKGAFARCGFEKIIIPEGVNIGKCAFTGCMNLREIILPDTGASIDEYAFSECPALKEIVLYDGSVGKGAFDSCKSLTKVIFKGTNAVIGECAFYDCSQLKDVSLEGVKEIKSRAFTGCNALESVVIPDSVEIMEDEAFYDCPELKSVVMPKNKKSLRKDIFSDWKHIKFIFT